MKIKIMDKKHYDDPVSQSHRQPNSLVVQPLNVKNC